MKLRQLLPKLSIAFVMLALFTSTAFSQAPNVMHFSGVSDYVSVPGASQYIANSAQMSITCWVYPTNAAPAYPNFDGFAGIRNDVDADFYMVQVSPTNLECRFRNSSGTAFSLTSPVLTLNTWQHLAFTYTDGDMIRIFVNGVCRDSMAANGTITNNAVDFNIGNVHFTSAEFLLTGSLDEVSLWNTAVSPSDLQCIYKSAIDSAAPGLQLYYKFNQGVGGGNNVAIANLKDEKNHTNGTFVNMTLTGTASNFISGSPNSVVTTAHVCSGNSYTFNGTSYTNAGVYTDTLTSVLGCDSLTSLNLIVDTVNTHLTVIGNFLFAPASSNYQWVNCNTGFSAISGATTDTYTATVNGSYAVIVTQNGCVDTSNCITMSPQSIKELTANDALKVYPTLITDQLTIENTNLAANYSFLIVDAMGKSMIAKTNLTASKLQLSTGNWPAGMYSVIIQSGEGTKLLRVVKL